MQPNRLNMKKLILIIIVLIGLIGCRKQHVFNTYYKQIDVDTLQAISDDDGNPYYIIKSTELSNDISSAMGLGKMFEVIFYKPSNDTYFTVVFGNDGGRSGRIYFNPYSGVTDSIK